ncbi:hypothetical protein GEMRC1_006231 [Eukaryota sp. GEM-RC1]
MAISSTFSAPGKVLIVGGYCILTPNSTGIVLSSHARGYTNAVFHPAPSDDNSLTVVCYFIQRKMSWVFALDLSDLSLSSSSDSNPFIENAVIEVLRYLSSSSLPSGRLVLHTFLTSPFHSGCSSPTLFPPIPESSPKTGLGSSAVITVTCFASVLRCLQKAMGLPQSCPFTKEVFDHCQEAHKRAQTGSGSGFDIYAAIFGSSFFSSSNPSPFVLPSTLTVSTVRVVTPESMSSGVSSRKLLQVISGSKLVKHKFDVYCRECEVFVESFKSILQTISVQNFKLCQKSCWGVIKSAFDLSQCSGVPIIPVPIFLLFSLINLNLFSQSSFLLTGFSGAGGWDSFWIITLDRDFTDCQSILNFGKVLGLDLVIDYDVTSTEKVGLFEENLFLPDLLSLTED